MITAPKVSFHRRPLPSTSISFSSAEGRSIFQDALRDGTMEMYFPLSEVFSSQSDPAFCGVSTLTMVLNCLSVDPVAIHGERGIWKGPWRWYYEDLLDCCKPLDRVRIEGVTLSHMNCLAQCNGLETLSVLASNCNVNYFRQMLIELSKQSYPPTKFLVVNYDRATLGQSGSGHFSPIAGYESSRDMVLILDVARFKYPPHWVSVDSLFSSMQSLDKDTCKSRGFLVMSKLSSYTDPVIFTLPGAFMAHREIWELLSCWMKKGCDSIDEDLYKFIQIFNKNYHNDLQNDLIKSLKNSRTFQKSHCVTDAFPSNDQENIQNTRLSWTIIFLAINWSKNIMFHNEGQSCCSDTSCHKTLYPSIETIPNEIRSEFLTPELSSLPQDGDVSDVKNEFYLFNRAAIDEVIALTVKVTIIFQNECGTF